MLNNLLKAQLAAFLTAKLVQSPVFLSGVSAIHAGVNELRNVAYEALERATVDESIKPLPRQSTRPRSNMRKSPLPPRNMNREEIPIFDPSAQESAYTASQSHHTAQSNTTTTGRNESTRNESGSGGNGGGGGGGRTAPPPNESEGERLLREFIEKTRRDVAGRK